MISTVGQTFLDGSSGSLSISSDTTWSSVSGIVNVSCSGTIATNSLSATGSFSAGDMIVIHQSRGGANVGLGEINQVASYSAGTITTVIPLLRTYTDSGASQAQVQIMPSYTDVTIDNTKTLTGAAWNADIGGIIAFYCSGLTTVTGTISVNGKGYSGGAAGFGATGIQGEGTSGGGSASTSANGSGGGGGGQDGGSKSGGGGGGGHANSGTNGQSNAGGTGGTGGSSSGSSDLMNATLGGGGGGGSRGAGVTGTPGAGGNGGGLVIIISKKIVVTGAISADGNNGGNATEEGSGGGGGGGGGILIRSMHAEIGTNLLTASKGTGGTKGPGGNGGNGGDGSVGRIRIESPVIIGSNNDPVSSNQLGGNLWAGRLGLTG